MLMRGGQQAHDNVFLFISLSMVVMQGCERVDCVENNTTYLFVPDIKTTHGLSDEQQTKHCNSIQEKPSDTMTDQDRIELAQCYYGGSVAAVKYHNTSSPEIEILPSDLADDHMIARGELATSGGSHDDSVPHINEESLNQVLIAIPDHLKSQWVRLNKGVSTGPNGCGIFATAVCNRILGRVESPIITQADWDDTYADLGSFNGVTPFNFISRYYQRLGYCSETKPVKGFCSDYEEMEKKVDQKCDVKLFFARKSSFWFLPSSNPHIETVVDVTTLCGQRPENYYAITNSWGNPAKVSGGFCTGFYHDLNKDYGGDADSFAWPADDARVWVQTTCPCNILQEHLDYVDDLIKLGQQRYGQTSLLHYEICLD